MVFTDPVLVMTCKEVICIDQKGFGSAVCLPLMGLEVAVDYVEATATYFSHNSRYVACSTMVSDSFKQNKALQIHVTIPSVLEHLLLMKNG